jgi:hypothetical protein
MQKQPMSNCYQTFALRVKYQEDKSEDFKIIGNQIIIDVFECSGCGEYGEKYRELIRYAHTTYIKYDPAHFVEWQCPKHPGVKTIHIDEYIEDIPLHSNVLEDNLL